jgi:lysophospholipase L1-like esterase
MALFESLNAKSSPQEIAAAYSQFTAGAGGDTTANQDIARSFLESRGIGAPVIEQSYNQFLQPAQVANTAGVGAQGIGVAGATLPGTVVTQNQGLPTTAADVSTQGLGSLAQATNPNVLGGVILGGDSYLSNGYVANNLATNLGQHVTNTAIGGQTTTDVLNQLNTFTGAGGVFNPGSTVVLNVGGNDLLQGVDKATVQNNLNTIVSRLGALGVNVVLSGASDVGSVSDVTGSTNLAMADLYNNVARNNKNVTLVDSMSGLLNDKSLVTEDGFHLTNPGLDRFSQALLGGLSTSMGAKQPAALPAPSYEGLTAASTPDEIARAYYKFTGEAGGDTKANQDTARTFLESLGIATPTITGAYKDYNELAGLKSSFGVQDGQAAPTQEGILSGFKYANDSGISEKDMEQVLGKDVFNTYKTGFADYAKTGIANILADKQLSFDEARTAVKFGRDYGYDTQKLADLTGTKKEVLDAIYKNYDDTTNKIVDSVLGAEDVKTNDDKIIRALALQSKFGFTDDDLAKAADFTPAQVKGFLDPVRNFGSDLNKILTNTDSTLAETKKLLETAKTNGAINQLYGAKLEPLDAKIAEMEDRWKSFEGVEPMHAQRVYDQIGQQREKLGDQYYRGVFGDPLVMAATLAKKGIDTLADIGQKDKYEATPAEKRYFAPDGSRVDDLGDGTFGVIGAEGGYSSVVPKSQVKTEYGYTEQELREGPEGSYSVSKFVPLSDKDVDKDGNYQKLMGKVAIDKDTGKEIADLDGKIAQQSSSGGLRKKSNSLNVAFTKDGVPVLTASSQRAGLGALVQDLAPMISMALPFILPGVGSALSSMLPGAGVAASGATAAIAPTLMNQALTQGILSGGLTTLGGGQFEKGFLSGAVNPVINAGISNMLPANIGADMSRMLTNVGTGAVRGALQGGDFKDLLAGGITSGLADYGVNAALGASGLNPQQLNFATGIVAPLLQGQKINPMTAFGTLANVGQQTQGARP